MYPFPGGYNVFFLFSDWVTVSFVSQPLQPKNVSKELMFMGHSGCLLPCNLKVKSFLINNVKNF